VKSVIVALETAAGASLAGLDGEGRIAAVRRFAENQPELFAAVRSTLYFSYYQAPLVVEAVRALGIAYNDAPQPHGYLMDPFDPTPGKDAPSLPRGSYIPTAAVTRLPTLPPATHATRSEQ
jgi:hypothetical protein